MRQWDKMDDLMRHHALDEAARAGAMVIEYEMERRAPFKRGVLKANIQSKQSGKPSPFKAAYNVGPTRKASHAIPVELGHNLVRVLKDGTKKIVGYVAPVPFMRNAYHAKKAEAAKAVGDTLKGMIERLQWLK